MIIISIGIDIICMFIDIICMFWASLVAQSIKNLPAVQETWVQPLVNHSTKTDHMKLIKITCFIIIYLNCFYSLYVHGIYSITNSIQEIVKDSEDWCAAVHEVAKSQTWLSDWITMKNNTYSCVYVCTCVFIIYTKIWSGIILHFSLQSKHLSEVYSSDIFSFISCPLPLYWSSAYFSLFFF